MDIGTILGGPAIKPEWLEGRICAREFEGRESAVFIYVRRRALF